MICDTGDINLWSKRICIFYFMEEMAKILLVRFFRFPYLDPFHKTLILFHSLKINLSWT